MFFVLTAKAFPDLMPNRVDTWTSRISSFMDPDVTVEDYQIEKAKIAIATGGIQGLGPGKSVQKNFLPQSSSDFIFAIIIEEYGLIGGMSLLFLYLWLLFRIVIVAQKSETVFGKLLSYRGWDSNCISSLSKYGCCCAVISCNWTNITAHK